jgi:transcriptional regulator with XRE-family HTH domain
MCQLGTSKLKEGGETTMFGSLVKEKRLALNLGLREFCRKIQEDPSNWSKVERGINAPPQSIEKLNLIANVLGLKKEQEQYIALLDEAAVGAGKIPRDLLSDRQVLNALPAFLRTLGSIKPSEKEIKDLIEILRKDA